MRYRTAQDHRVKLVCFRNVANESPPSTQQPNIFDPFDRAAYTRLTAVHHIFQLGPMNRGSASTEPYELRFVHSPGPSYSLGCPLTRQSGFRYKRIVRGVALTSVTSADRS